LTDTNTVPASRQDHPAAELRLGEGDVEIAIDSHDFAGALHFRSEHRIGPGEAREREHRFLDRDMADVAVDRLEVAISGSPAITRAAILAIGGRSPWRRTARCGWRAD
jgi:hypothetical protein